ncbi:glycosyltransferase family 4 protein [Cyclobacterium amurskyense]|uniref:Glycosyl transferase family 1 domain-containing protein n=1 Tax=Cyclobacterium amurskyense TaxID=320787 RepID=A0A0H4PXB9_9BACT|nr:glycosyltransferase family 4 protein [Cyclobacterium amurskyense]AKP53017.1 hypothetical protein CA2015_3640 [Cyclobacterium amurskyense]
MKKLLFAISSLKNSGGSERSLIYRVNYLVQNFNYDITIVTTDKDDVYSFYKIDSKVKVVNIPVKINKPSIWNSIGSLIYKSYKRESKIKEFIKENKFDICSSVGSVNFLYQSKKNDSFIKVKESRFNYKRFFPDKRFNIGILLWRLLRLINSTLVLKKMDYVITLTEEDAKFWRKFLNKVYVMPNFINFKHISLSNLNSNNVIAVGRLEREKDFTSLIKAFAIVSNKYNNWKLEIYGEGSLRNALQDLIVSLQLTDCVFLKGAIGDIFSKYEESSIYVHTSLYEGFGNSILEAMAHALPIVAFKSVGGVKLLVNDSHNGFSVPNRNIGGLAGKIIELIENPEMRRKMGHNSREIASNFSEDKIMLQWHKFYSKI